MLVARDCGPPRLHVSVQVHIGTNIRGGAWEPVIEMASIFAEQQIGRRHKELLRGGEP